MPTSRRTKATRAAQDETTTVDESARYHQRQTAREDGDSDLQLNEATRYDTPSRRTIGERLSARMMKARRGRTTNDHNLVRRGLPPQQGRMVECGYADHRLRVRRSIICPMSYHIASCHGLVRNGNRAGREEPEEVPAAALHRILYAPVASFKLLDGQVRFKRDASCHVSVVQRCDTTRYEKLYEKASHRVSRLFGEKQMR
jgi:hypothetical protein